MSPPPLCEPGALHLSAWLPIPFNAVLPAGQEASAVLLTRISRESWDPCVRKNLQEPAPVSDTYTLIDTSPPSSPEALPWASQGHVVCERAGEPLCGTLGLPYWACSAAAEETSSSKKSRVGRSMATANPSPVQASLFASGDQTSGSYRLPE